MPVQKKFPYRSAYIACSGSCRTDEKTSCLYGCTGCGQCVDACRFGAVSIGENKTAVIDEEKCIGCGMCKKACPRQIIHIHDRANYIVVRCSNKDKGKEAREVCPSSCIGCGICEKTCTAEAIKVTDHCAGIIEENCLSCGMCVVKCPRHAVADQRGLLNH